MKVIDLIKALSSLNPNSEVVVADGLDVVGLHSTEDRVYISDSSDHDDVYLYVEHEELQNSFQLEEEAFFPDDYALLD